MVRTGQYDVFVDKDFARWCCNHNMKWSDSNFFVSDNVGILSNCPVSGGTKILYLTDRCGKLKTTSIEKLYRVLRREGGGRTVLIPGSRGKMIRARVNRFSIPCEYEIRLVNGAKLITTGNHLNKTSRGGYVPTKDLTTDDFLPFSKNLPEVSPGDLSYEDEVVWVKVKSISKGRFTDISYCMEVLDDEAEPVFRLANGIHTHNCRLLSDTQKLDAFINSIGGTALSVGSCRVSTVNLVRIAYESGLNKKKYLKILRERILLNCKALTSMRHIIQRNIEKGLLPNYQDGAVELDKQFCTVGAIGVFEVMDLFGLIETDEFGCRSYSDEAVAFTNDILDTINEVKDTFECDFTFNLEMIPAENCAGVICQADNLLYEQNKYFIYSNQWIPLMEKCTLQEKCRLGSLFDKKCGGGCIAHIDIENRFPNEETAWEMLNYVASQGVIYFAFTTKISVCRHKHAFISEPKCPVCGEPVADTYARVVGFYTPVSSYQKIRKAEFDKRRWMNVLSGDNIIG